MVELAGATHHELSKPTLRGFEIQTAPPSADLPKGFAEFYAPLHARFTPWQQELAAKRKEVLKKSQEGHPPEYLPASEAITSHWKIVLPEWVTDQRNQMTGPGDDAELCVKMLNSGAPGVMLDLEDSMANKWENLQSGVPNIHAALRGKLTYFDKKRSAEIAIKPSKTVIFTRARGLHLSQRGGFGAKTAAPAELGRGDNNELTSASLYDVARVVYELDASELKHPLCFYIPKSESADEALWWADLFKRIAHEKGWETDYIKCMALVESHPLAFQIEEFLYNLRDHIVGLNLGRWDYMASLIHFNLENPEWVLPDRNTIPHDVRFFQNLRELIPSVCHRRGALAIGGMTALYPSREDAELNARALDVLAKDKKNEANCGMDGAWTGHPDQNQIAVDQFPVPNQLGNPSGAPDKSEARHPDLRPVPKGVGKRTLAGTRAAIRTVIRYRNGVLNGKGASLLDGYMEDLATDRIYRLMIAQRIRHADKVEVLDEDEGGKPVKHTPELISRLFDEELEKILRAPGKDLGTPETFTRARQISEAMILNHEFDPI
ncbi:MAG: Malate synthase [Acidobacteriaceae bacterium]|nr:Malate synthase [Acidobacteriaceae bacterium]